MLMILIFYAIASVVTFSVYAIDKSAARQNRWRITENTLHLLSLIGGWPGALIAQRTLRHKNRKLSFQLVYWITVSFNLVIVFWVFKTGLKLLMH